MSKTGKQFFSQVLSITGGAAVSLASLMGIEGWGLEKDSNNDIIVPNIPSLDSFIGDSGAITPLAGTLYVGYDEFVRNAAAAGPPRVYQGAPTAVNVPFDLGNRCQGIVDPYHVWLYSVATQDLVVVFGGF